GRIIRDVLVHLRLSRCLGQGGAHEKCILQDLLAGPQNIEQHTRLAIEFRGQRLLQEILAHDQITQDLLDDVWILLLVGRHIGQPQFVFEFLSRHTLPPDVSDTLTASSRWLVAALLAASRQERNAAYDRDQVTQSGREDGHYEVSPSKFIATKGS